jgi:uncharacterized membrane protein
VRVANCPADLAPADPTWRRPRILYYHHPSDPVGYATVRVLWEEPGWTRSPRGYDVSPRALWFPIVTGIQSIGDLAAGFGASSGHGHNYSSDFTSGWAAVAAPEGWSDADSRMLQDHLDLDPPQADRVAGAPSPCGLPG